VHGFLLAACYLALGATAAPPTHPSIKPLTATESATWTMYVVPLPKNITITGQITCRPEQVTLEVPDDAPPLVRRAAEELRRSLGHRMEIPSAPTPVFTLVLRTGGSDTSELSQLKNSDQAYRIVPLKNQAGLKLVALGPHGLYYAAQTLRQLIEAKATDRFVTLPILTVTDWPDIADRGVWGTDTPHHIPWLAGRKFNYMEQVATILIDENKQPVVGMREPRRRMLDEGPRYGINPVPAIVHLERLGSKGVYDAYPDLKGQGPNVHPGAACYSNPKIVDILADWILGCARLPGVSEVDVWMTENLGKKTGCQCPKCRGKNRDLLEARAILAAWEKAKQKIPSLRLRLLTTEETFDSDEQIITLAPPGVTIWYYHSLTTYSNRETPIIPPALAQLARRGHRIGVVPDFGVKSAFPQPFTGAHFVRYRMNEFVDKHIAAVLGYPRPGVAYCDFNMEAAAEWSWNAKGRSTREFARSWAVRRRLPDPELFAEWSETIGPVAWDVYGSEWPRGEMRTALDTVATQLVQGTLPELGEVLWGVYPKPWGDIKTPEQLNNDVARAAHALALAHQMGIPRFIEESRVIQGYIGSLKALYELKQLIRPTGLLKENKQAAGRYFQDYIDSLRQAQDGIVRWEQAIVSTRGQRLIASRTTEVLDTLIEEMKKTAAKLGCSLE